MPDWCQTNAFSNRRPLQWTSIRKCPQRRLDNDSSWCCCSVNSCTLKCPWKMRQRWQQLVRSAVRQTSNKGHAGHSEIYIKLQHCLQCQTRVDKNAYESAKPEGIPMENCWICPNELVLQSYLIFVASISSGASVKRNYWEEFFGQLTRKELLTVYLCTQCVISHIMYNFTDRV